MPFQTIAYKYVVYSSGYEFLLFDHPEKLQALKDGGFEGFDLLLVRDHTGRREAIDKLEETDRILSEMKDDYPCLIFSVQGNYPDFGELIEDFKELYSEDHPMGYHNPMLVQRLSYSPETQTLKVDVITEADG